MTDSTSKVEWVTPAMATEWVARNPRNRAISKAHVMHLVREIKSGAWRITHQGIAFGENGTLFDGQHRLHAIIAANAAVQVLVTRGLSQTSLDAIDTGNARRAADVLAIADGKHITRVKRGSLIAAMTMIRFGTLNICGSKTTVADLRAACDAFESDYEALSDSIKFDRLAQAPAMGAMLICHALSPDAAVKFARAYRDPSSSGKHHPAVTLREYVLLGYVSGNSAGRSDLAARVFTAFQAFRQSQSRKIVRGAQKPMIEAINAWRTAHGMPSLGIGSEDDE